MGEKEKEAVVTAGEELIELGRKEGERKMLLKLLRARFGELPGSAVAQVNAAAQAEIELWVERVITAPSLAEVLGNA